MNEEKNPVDRLVSCNELKEICSLVVELTKLRQDECKHLCIENFAPALLATLLGHYSIHKQGKILTVEAALEIESHFITASKALRCAFRNMNNYQQFESSAKEVAMTIVDVDESAEIMRQWITDNT